jgi:hypothetical protein
VQSLIFMNYLLVAHCPGGKCKAECWRIITKGIPVLLNIIRSNTLRT